MKQEISHAHTEYEQFFSATFSKRIISPKNRNSDVVLDVVTDTD